MPHINPVFGAAKIIEHEVAAINAFKQLGYLSQHPDEFELIERLRVTKPKGRALLCQTALREISSADQVDQELREVLSNPWILVDGDFYLIEIPQPLTMDRLRHRVRQLGSSSDGSFSGNLARIKRTALVALIESLILEEIRDCTYKQLSQQDYEGAGTQPVIIAILRTAGAKVAGQVGDDLVSQIGGKIGEKLGDFFDVVLMKLRAK